MPAGVASYAIVADDAALIYDTYVSLEHAWFIRRQLERKGVTSFTVVLSHWHLDHVAGMAVFSDSEIVASARTRELLSRYKGPIERGEHEGPPPIDPLMLPTSVFVDRLRIARLSEWAHRRGGSIGRSALLRARSVAA